MIPNIGPCLKPLEKLLDSVEAEKEFTLCEPGFWPPTKSFPSFVLIHATLPYAPNVTFIPRLGIHLWKYIMLCKHQIFCTWSIWAYYDLYQKTIGMFVFFTHLPQNRPLPGISRVLTPTYKVEITPVTPLVTAHVQISKGVIINPMCSYCWWKKSG